MGKQTAVISLLKQSPFLAFSAEDLKTIRRRSRSRKYVFARFAYQWKDANGQVRKALVSSLKKKLKGLCAEAAKEEDSNHKLNFASLRAEAGTYLMRKIMVDILSADILLFDLTYANPNVYFELGAAYTTGRRLFLLHKEGSEKIPSDLTGLTLSYYRGEMDSFSDSRAESDLRTAMREAIKNKAVARKKK